MEKCTARKNCVLIGSKIATTVFFKSMDLILIRTNILGYMSGEEKNFLDNNMWECISNLSAVKCALKGELNG